MNNIGNFTQNPEIQEWWRHGLKVLGCCKKCPSGIKGKRQELRLLNAVNFQVFFPLMSEL